MRKVLITLITLVLSSYTLTTSAATASSSLIKLSEVDCNNEWFEITNTSTLTINVKNFQAVVVATDGTVIQDTFSFPAAKIKPGKFKVYTDVEMGFGLACGDESIILQDPSAKEIDRIAIPNLAESVTWSRFASGWAGSSSTAGLANIALPAGQAIDQAAWIFDPMQSFRINLAISQANLDALVASPKEYVAATFRFKDSANNSLPAEGVLQIGVRTKGSVGSTGGGSVNIQNGKIGLKIKFNWSVPGQQFLGLKRMTLNNMMQDPAMVRDVLSYKLFTDMGIVAPRTGFARVYINSGNGLQYKGLFLNLEAYDEIMMARWRTSMQHMYDATWAQGWNSGSQACVGNWYAPEITLENYRCNFEVDRGDPTNMSDIGNLAQAMHSQDSLTADAKKLVDVSQIARFFAVEKYINHWDGQSGSPPWTPNNYRMFSDKNGKIELLPWGTDGTWFAFPEPLPDWIIGTPFDGGMESFYFSRSKLFMQCINEDQCNSEYLKALQKISEIAQYQDLANELFDLHTAARAADTTRWSDEGTSAWELSNTLSFIANRDEMAHDYSYEHATGAIRWTPAKTSLNVGSKLTASLLNAYSDVLGTITYSKKLGAVLKKGKYSIKATLTPVDVAEWPVQSKTIKFTVK